MYDFRVRSSVRSCAAECAAAQLSVAKQTGRQAGLRHRLHRLHLRQGKGLRAVVEFQEEDLLLGLHLHDLGHPAKSREAWPLRRRYIDVPPCSVVDCTRGEG